MEITKSIVEYSNKKGKKLSLLELEELKKFEPRIYKDVFAVLTPSRAIIARRSSGATNPVQVRKAIRAARRKYIQ